MCWFSSIDPDYAHSQHTVGEPTDETDQNATANTTAHANATSNNTTSNSTNAMAPYNLLDTSNPVWFTWNISNNLWGCCYKKKKIEL